jgi:hypothetical protein
MNVLNESYLCKKGNQDQGKTDNPRKDATKENFFNTLSAYRWFL